MSTPDQNTDPLGRLHAITDALGTTIADGQKDIAINGVSIDTRTIKKDDLFVALVGDAGDGHDYIDTAFQNHAAATLVHKDDMAGGPIVKSDDTLKALEKLAITARDRSDAVRIAVTGSAGKTGTKEMLGIVFEAFGQTHCSIKSYNNHWGVPLTLANMHAATDFGVFEIGMNHSGEISDLTKMVRPDIAIITSILPVHIENFDSEQDIARAKAEIFDSMQGASTAIINADTPHYDLIRKIAADHGIENIYGFGEDSELDSYPKDLKLSSDGTKVTAKILGERVKFHLSIPGKHIAMNAIAVLTAAKAAGLDLQKVADVLSKAEPIEGRGKKIEVTLKDGEPPLVIIDESYNANPAAMKAAFKVLEMNTPKGEGRRIAVLGDMLELGPKGPQMHAGLANPLLKAHADLVFTCGPQMGALYDVLPEPWKGAHTKDSHALCSEVIDIVKPGDVILVKGSNGSKMAYVVEALQKLNSHSQEVA